MVEGIDVLPAKSLSQIIDFFSGFVYKTHLMDLNWWSNPCDTAYVMDFPEAKRYLYAKGRWKLRRQDLTA